jgi:CheY-like chemotaxis protein
MSQKSIEGNADGLATESLGARRADKFAAGQANPKATLENLIAVPARAATAPSIDASPEHARILLVDDKPELLRSLSEVVSLHGYQVTEALGGRAALDALVVDDFDVVLLDLIMPEVSGHDVLDYAAKHRIATKIIVVSGDSSFSGVQKTL